MCHSLYHFFIYNVSAGFQQVSRMASLVCFMVWFYWQILGVLSLALAIAQW